MILVCGGAGYIGSHMCRLLRQHDIPHIALDNLERGHAEALQGTPLIHADLRNPAALEEVFASHTFTAVMHFAAYIEVGESTKNPATFWENNVHAVWNLLETMRRHGVNQFVFSSTAAVYGEPERVPIPEDHPKNPTNPYGNTKLTVERMLGDYSDTYGLRSVCLRYFNACGSDPDGILGEAHDPETHLIPRVLLAAAGRGEVKVFGEDYDTPDGTCIRDYVHVCDLADAHLLALNHLATGGATNQYNLGSGTGFSVKQVIDAAKEVTGIDFPVGTAPRRTGDPARLIADSTKARTELGWNPVYTDVRTCVQHAWDWMLAHPNGYKS